MSEIRIGMLPMKRVLLISNSFKNHILLSGFVWGDVYKGGGGVTKNILMFTMVLVYVPIVTFPTKSSESRWRQYSGSFPK